MTPEGGNEARLERLQGGVDLINERLLHANRIADERHEAIKAELTDVKNKVHRHGNELQPLIGLPARVDALEDADKLREGQRQGIITSGRALIWLAGLIPGGLIVAVLSKAFGG